MKKLFFRIAFVVLLSLAAVGTYSIYHYFAIKADAGESLQSDKSCHITKMTVNDVKRELCDISELLTYEYDYTGVASIEDCCQTYFLGLDVPLTNHEIKMTYAGSIKFGYDLQEITVDIDNDRKEIKISLGKQIVENNLPEESVETVEKNNLINPIRSDEVTNKLAEIKTQEYDNAIQQGVQDLAREKVQEIIKDRLSDISYSVVFIDNMK